eukprot:TRINITY_DN390_c0_g1_i2.p1 TRINITY_DN390_c0_g1~~TRINITY_DN390_c0_g1_i2.p1  ORF type:complete len:417 (-),score=59.71 TRINITY_DN390_c0_g1_i2:1549-2799(-)
MGKIADPSLRLQCVSCHSTETPLWRAGPDGPKTLCNACGVRYKKGKLILFKDDNGNPTAVQRVDAVPYHIPPTSKKASRKTPSPASQPSSPDLSAKRSAIRKIPSEGAITPPFGKKPRSRSRRANAGQLPGRYATKTLPDTASHQYRSPTSSPRISPTTGSNPPSSPIENRIPPLNFQRLYTVNEPPLSKFIDPEDESMFPDMASLGLDCSPRANNTVVLPMPVDASCVEQFSFAFTGCGNSLKIDAPDRREALRGLLLDRTRKLSRTYEATVGALARLCEQRYHNAKAKNMDGKLSSVEDCRNFVRAFAHEQSCGFGLEEDGLCSVDEVTQMMSRSNSVAIMLPEMTAHCNAVNCFKALMDSSELEGFAEACMVELLAEDVIAVLAQQGHAEFEKETGCRVPEAAIQPKAIPTPA